LKEKKNIMLKKALCPALLGLSLACVAVAATPDTNVSQIVERHIAARGGVQAWHAVQTLSVSGKMEAGTGDSVERSQVIAHQGLGASVKKQRADIAARGSQGAAPAQVELPFRLEMKRPHRSRLEVDFAGKTAVQVYDGQNGWKYRPFLNRSDVEPFTAEEAKYEAAHNDMEDPLLDYASKGTQVELAGTEMVAGHSAYKLKLTLRGGDTQNVWIDTQSYLDVKVQGVARKLDGRMRDVWVYQRDFRSVQGVKLPFEYETVVDGGNQSHRMLIDTIAVNRALDDARFAKPKGS
jgi:outer membrane lipoprotein-sorting protein